MVLQIAATLSSRLLYQCPRGPERMASIVFFVFVGALCNAFGATNLAKGGNSLFFFFPSFSVCLLAFFAPLSGVFAAAGEQSNFSG